jgi:hypothetical protein
MNAFLNILNNPAQPIKQEFGWLERHTIVKALEEKINDAFEQYDNNEQHTKTIDVWNEWLYWLNEMWDGKLNYSFEQRCNNVGLELHEVYGIIIDIMTTKHLDTLCRLDELEYKNNTTQAMTSALSDLRMMDDDDDMEWIPNS